MFRRAALLRRHGLDQALAQRISVVLVTRRDSLPGLLSGITMPRSSTSGGGASTICTLRAEAEPATSVAPRSAATQTRRAGEASDDPLDQGR
jgi:hypothetical protein